MVSQYYYYYYTGVLMVSPEFRGPLGLGSPRQNSASIFQKRRAARLLAIAPIGAHGRGEMGQRNAACQVAVLVNTPRRG